MTNETRIERRVERAVARATTPRAAVIVIATTSIGVTVLAGILMVLADRENFPTIGSGLWWAIQTTTTVGYGDNVPTTTPGRLIASLVMLFGIGFLTVVTAAITSALIERSRLDRNANAPTAEQIRRLDERLERIEAALGDRS